FDNEIDTAFMRKNWAWEEVKPQVHKIHRTGAGSFDPQNDDYLILLAEGRLVNLGNATGHPSRIMDGSFANQVLAQIFLFGQKYADLSPAQKAERLTVEVLPKKLDEEVALEMVRGFGGVVTKLTKTQADYIGVPVEGYNPDFFSCTYGAGGSTRDRTINTVLQLEKEVNVPAAPHLSCVGDSKDDLRGLLTQYKDAGINRIVALRGDLPSGMGMASGELRHANDLVTFIREETGSHFHIEVAAYPEMHPQARNFEDDLKNFVRKANAGADSAITQYFFNADSYFYFVERVEKM
nr:5,10-methylenetetrahydrofolate reductase [Tanacetum cinerariifolium]